MHTYIIYPDKNNFLIAILLLTIFASVYPLNSFAQEEKKERGWRGEITKDDLLEKLKAGEVNGYVIKGKDIIEIIRDSDLEIRIENSIIEGGLDFSRLPVDERQRVISNGIVISNSTIKFWETTDVQSEHGEGMHLSIFMDNFTNTNIFVKYIIFFNSQFDGKAYFNRAQFDRGAMFHGVRFDAEADFTSAQFGVHGADFTNAQFKSRSTFMLAKFAKADFASAQFEGTTNFDFVSFQGVAKFWSAHFFKFATFRSSHFNGKSYFRGSQFNAEAYFNRAQFDRGADFRKANFKKSATFQNATFSTVINLEGVLFVEYLDFRNSIIKALNWKNTGPTITQGRIDFRKSWITESHFENLVLENDVDFSDVEFGNPFILFKQGDFDWEGLLQELADCDNSVKVSRCKDLLDYFPESQQRVLSVFQENMDVFETNKLITLIMSIFNSILENKDWLEKHTNEELIGENQYQKKLVEKNLKRLTDYELAYLNRVTIENLYNEYVYENIDFLIANQGYSTVFKFVTFESDARFIRTKFNGNTAFEDVNFEKEVNFTNATFESIFDRNTKFSFSYVNFNNLIIEFDQLPKMENWVIDTDNKILSFLDKNGKNGNDNTIQPISEVLTGLETNFSRNKMLNDRNQAYFHLKQAKVDEARKNSSLSFWERFLIKAESILWGWTTGYGTKIWWIIGWYLGFFAIFSVIYWKWGRFFRKANNEDSQFRLRLIVFPWQYFAPKITKQAHTDTPNIVEAMRLSKELIFKLGYRNITIAGGRLLKTLVVIEWALGYYLLACFVITLTNVSPLLNRLISGVF